METNETESTPQSATEAEQTGGEAAGTAQGYVSEATRTEGSAQNSAAQDTRSEVKFAADTGRAFARDAVDAAGQKIHELKDHAAQLKERGTQFVVAEPTKAVAYAAAGSALLTAALLWFMRGRR